MVTAVIGILFLIILVIGHELGHFFAAKMFKLRVDEFGFGFPPRIFSKKRKETTYSFNLLPFGGYVKIYGEHPNQDEEIKEPERSFTHQLAWKRAVIIVAGAFMNFLIGWIAFSVVLAAGIPNMVLIERVIPGSPADTAGFSVGQVIEGFDSAEEFANFINSNRGEELELNNLNVIPRENPPEGEGPLGITVVDGGVEKHGVLQSIPRGFTSAVRTTWLLTGAFIGFIGSIVVGNFSVVEQVTGPVGVYGMLAGVSNLGVSPLIQFLGLISLNLVVINLLPFPALDGGRLLTIAVEKIVGRRLNYKFETIVNIVGLGLLLLLMIVVTIRDITNIL